MQAVSQLAVSAAIVASLLYLPLGALVALVSYVFAVPLGVLVTFGGAFDNMSLGLFAWWLAMFTGACVGATFVFPWGEKVLAWPRKK